MTKAQEATLAIQTEVTEEDLSTAKGQATKALNAATELKITKPEEMETASTLLKKISDAKKLISSRRKYYTDPINEGLKRIRATYKPIEEKLLEADKSIRGKMVDYNEQVAEENRKEQEKIEKEVEKGKITIEEGSKAIEKKTVEVKTSKVTFRTDSKVEIEDESLLPREYLMADMAKIKADAFSKVIPGVKIVEVKVPVVK